MADKVYKNPLDAAIELQKSPAQKYKRIRNVDDFQAPEFPDVSTKEFYDGYLNGDYDFIYDTEANDKLLDYVLQDLKVTPRQWNETVKDRKGARKYLPDYITEWEKKHNADWSEKPRRSDVQVWRDRATNYGKSVGGVWPLASHFKDLTDDDVQELIDVFGFDRKGEW